MLISAAVERAVEDDVVPRELAKVVGILEQQPRDELVHCRGRVVQELLRLGHGGSSRSFFNRGRRIACCSEAAGDTRRRTISYDGCADGRRGGATAEKIGRPMIRGALAGAGGSSMRSRYLSGFGQLWAGLSFSSLG